MKQWILSWNIMRLLRLAMAVFLIFQGIELKHWLVVTAGILFAILPILNIGSCATKGCSVNYRKTKSIKTVTFKEVN